MPKLDTTIDNLELKSNKVIGDIPSSAWTDAEYPSAKTLYSTYSKLLDLMHPIGSILTTSDDLNPADTLGGAWKLVDKAFRHTSTDLTTSHWTSTNASLMGTSSNVLLCDHTLTIRINLKTTIAITDDTVPLGKLSLPSLGLTQLTYAMFYQAIVSDGGNCTLLCKIDQDGTITVHDVLGADGTHSLASGNDFYIHVVLPVGCDNMLNNFCDKFYWKRTA